jgi:hypothetical protein
MPKPVIGRGPVPLLVAPSDNRSARATAVVTAAVARARAII